MNPLCASTDGEGSKQLAAVRGEARQEWAQPRWEVTGFSTWRLAEDACRLNKDSISQSLEALGCFHCLFKNPLSGARAHPFFFFFCAVPTAGPSLRLSKLLWQGCVALIGISVFENQTLAQLHSSQIAISLFPRLTFKTKSLPEMMTYPGQW